LIPSQSKRAFATFTLKAAIGAGLLWYVVTRIPLADALAVASTLDPITIAAVLILYFLAHAVNAAKLQIFLPQLSLWQAWRFTMIGVLYGTALPGQIAGDAVKALRLARIQADGEGAAAVAAVAVDKIVGIFALLLLTALAVGVAAQAFDTLVLLIAVLATVGASLALVAAFFVPIPAWLGRFGASIAAWRAVSLKPAALTYALVLGLLFQGICVVLHMVLGAALNIDFTFAAWAVVVGFSSIVLLAPVTIAGIGLREVTLVSIIGYLGGREVGAFALSLVLFMVTVMGAVVGLLVDLAGRDRT
jgi:uncharacterized membrane protein YbhN (UPF0104 family)